MIDSQIYYSVKALLYSPADNSKIPDRIISEAFGTAFSLALCLEDTIRSAYVEQAEAILVDSIGKIYEAAQTRKFFIPKIFIRVRRKEQIKDLYRRLGNSAELITGFIFPKFSPENADDFIDSTMSCHSRQPIYMMPILENHEMINPLKRAEMLFRIKEKITPVENHILNIRVGGNDLSGTLGIRRHIDETIYDIRPVANIFSDIICIFGQNYVVSAPVWEYYNGDGWDTGLKAEIKADKLMGFFGKTAVHPRQIPVINEAYTISDKDLDDAKAILNWSDDNNQLVSGNDAKERMNEYNTHYFWAKKIMYQYYAKY